MDRIVPAGGDREFYRVEWAAGDVRNRGPVRHSLDKHSICNGRSRTTDRRFRAFTAF